MNILLVIDKANYSNAVTNAVLAQRPAQETSIKVLQVVEPPALLVTREMGGYDPELEIAIEAQHQDARENVEKVAEMLRYHGFEVNTVAEHGDPKAKILEVAEQWPADLIVIDAHEQSGLQGLMSRSIVQSVAKHAPCSVELVRESEHSRTKEPLEELSKRMAAH
jgi:nucleotide-binding universal stress UspA family protein